MGFPGDSDGKAPTCNAGDPGLIPESGRAPGEGNGYPLQHSCFGNPMDIGTWWVTVHGVVKTRAQLTHTYTHTHTHTHIHTCLNRI